MHPLLQTAAQAPHPVQASDTLSIFLIGSSTLEKPRFFQHILQVYSGSRNSIVQKGMFRFLRFRKKSGNIRKRRALRKNKPGAAGQFCQLPNSGTPAVVQHTDAPLVKND